MSNYPPQPSPWSMPAGTQINYWLGNVYIGAFSQTVSVYVREDGGAWNLLGTNNPDVIGTYTTLGGAVDFRAHIPSDGDLFSYNASSVSPGYAVEEGQGQVGNQNTRVATTGWWHCFVGGVDQYVFTLDWDQTTPSNPFPGGLSNRPPTPPPWTFANTTFSWSTTHGSARQTYVYAQPNGGLWEVIGGSLDVGSGTWTSSGPVNLDFYYVVYATASADGGFNQGFGIYAGTSSATITGRDGGHTIQIQWVTSDGTVTIHFPSNSGWVVGRIGT